MKLSPLIKETRLADICRIPIKIDSVPARFLNPTIADFQLVVVDVGSADKPTIHDKRGDGRFLIV